MYLPAAFREERVETLVEFMRANSFVTLVSLHEGGLVASHIPVVVRLQDGVVTLVGHLAKANQQWQAFDQGESLGIFAGPHAYISPSLYEKPESVPTWNYQAVHAYGTPRSVSAGTASPAVSALLDELIATYEVAYQQQWASQSPKFRNGMMQGIVAFEMDVTRLEGKYKLSQNRSERDQRTVADALSTSDDGVVAGIGHAMQHLLTQREHQP